MNLWVANRTRGNDETSCRRSRLYAFMKDGKYIPVTDWRFVHKARLNIFPLNSANRRGRDPICRRCGYQRETLPHVINRCMRHAQTMRLRHNARKAEIHSPAPLLGNSLWKSNSPRHSWKRTPRPSDTETTEGYNNRRNLPLREWRSSFYNSEKQKIEQISRRCRSTKTEEVRISQSCAVFYFRNAILYFQSEIVFYFQGLKFFFELL